MGRTMPAAASLLLGIAAMVWVAVPLPLRAGVLAPTPGERTTSTGDIRFSASAVAYRHESRESRVEFFLRVPYREIRFLPVGGEIHEARVRVTVELVTADGKKRVAHQQQEARVQCTDVAATTDSTLGEIYSVGLLAPPGRYRYRALVEDMNVARRGLVYQMQNRRRQGEVAGAIDLGDWLYRDPALSGIEFAWAVRARNGESPFARGPYEVLPHPSGHFGLLNDSVTIYYEIYGSPPPPEGRVYRIRTTIWSASRDTLHRSVDSLRVTEGQAWPHAMSFDLSAYPHGLYQIRLDIVGAAGEPLASTQSSFDVLWSMESWAPDAADFYEVAALTLLSAEEAREFRGRSRGEKEAVLENLWRKLDPTPDTAANETRTEFRRRVDYANAHFTIFQRGMFTDRGQVWIRYGEPDEIKVERMPTLERTTIGYQLDDLPASARESIMRSRPETGTADSRPYEIWTYQFRGRELASRERLSEVSSGMKFVFVDEQGYGEYNLRYSSTGSSR